MKALGSILAVDPSSFSDERIQKAVKVFFDHKLCCLTTGSDERCFDSSPRGDCGFNWAIYSSTVFSSARFSLIQIAMILLENITT